MPNRIQKHRQSAFMQQQGRCYYCLRPMWVRDIGIFAIEHTISLKVARQYQCTAEHLVAKQDGGRDIKSNIAAACIRCNRERHRHLHAPSADEYRELVKQTTKRKQEKL